MDDSAGLHRPDHAAAVSDELAWLSAAIDARLTAFFADQDAPVALPDPPPLNPATALGDLTIRADLDPAGRLVLALALAPHVDAAVLDPFHVRNTAIGRAFSQFGGHHGADGFHPTIATALFLVAGAATRDRIEAMGLFAPDHPLRRDVGLSLRTGQGAGAAHGAILDLPPHRAVALCSGVAPPPDVAPGFPAQRLTTRLDWSDLVLPDDLMHRLGHIEAWLRHRPVILSDWGLSRQVGGGFKALFHGPPGTGKTLTAALLGKRTGLDVYRIDLSMVVSKYIGETEKNLGLVFDMAAERDWILFFDEADALFGARTTTTTANDRYANQEVSYLLQRIEACESLVLLATNLRTNIDDA
ncbi:MAG: ATP-binding protein, partial [Pseudomonadota bacterium]